MTACTSFGDTARSTPLTISVPSSASATCRFFSSRRANVAFRLDGLRIRPKQPSWQCLDRSGPAVPAAAGRPRNDIGTLAAVKLLSPWDILIIAGVLLLIFGPKRLPQMGRSLGGSI